MILNLQRTETAVLLLHMSMMRKNARNVFKANYGRNDYKEVLNSFDEVKIELENVVENSSEDEPEEAHIFHFNINEIDMIISFLNAYIPKLQDTLKRSGEIVDEDWKQIQCLKVIQDKANRMKGVQGVV
ncbi:hypothetical protein FH966_14730 [Lentibacillus cibarius]|uniref:Uncharacterized protein n=1 Tax=Lentibacillus cibarius TaxID=2583219 RepID=A0A549YLV1_9BACI|nr:hypothetical protein [Lentibacillus cibarius]TRM08784.1 hypothetical protein FH966_16545 [Lentibacillus cibarius]TRM08811.1 hypothetical protein FH966_16690 [Lentibacillus cibarius]TRM12858.1 hypothetical protein FH966_14730 [Lentibacillus cibarius]